LSLFAEKGPISTGSTSVEATPFVAIDPPESEPVNVSAAHAAAALRYGDRYLLKIFRHVEQGVSPELEVTRFLNQHAPALAPQVAGALELRAGRAEPSTLAVLEAYVPNEGSAWTHAREELQRFFERVLTRHREMPAPTGLSRRPTDMARAEIPPAVREVVGAYLDTVALLGRRTADLHRALSSDPTNPAFRPEPYLSLDRRSKYQSMRNLAGKTLRLLRENLAWLPASTAGSARALVEHPDRTLKFFEPLLSQRLTGLRIRTHGDYHLDQVLSTGKDFVIIDFEGRAGETLAERRRKHSALRDVAGMMRSFHYAALSASIDRTIVREVDREVIAPWADAWHKYMSGAFLRAYVDGAEGAPFIPAESDLPLVLETHLVEKAFLELRDELLARAETVAIPLAGLAELLGL
jgi:maltose alpha-D-glucosyltransferase/alpha-amylase